MDRLEIVVNGEVIRTVDAEDPYQVTFQGDIPVPQGGWIAARVLGPSSRYVTDSYAFAHTSPVYVVRDGQAFRSAEDARFLAEPGKQDRVVANATVPALAGLLPGRGADALTGEVRRHARHHPALHVVVVGEMQPLFERRHRGRALPGACTAPAMPVVA